MRTRTLWNERCISCLVAEIILEDTTRELRATCRFGSNKLGGLAVEDIMTHEGESQSAEVTTTAEAGNHNIGVFACHLHLLLGLKTDDCLMEGYMTHHRTQGVFAMRSGSGEFNCLGDSRTERTRVIGKRGEDIEKLRKEVSDMMGVPAHINVTEVRKPELDAQLVAESIAQQLERRIMFRRAMKRAVGNAMRLGALGIKVNVGGRLNGAEIARSEWYREGRVPLHTLRADIDYGTAEASTTYGIIGIKVWIYKGDPVLHITLTGAHTDFDRLLGDRLVREHADPHLAAALDVAADRAAGRFDLTCSQLTRSVACRPSALSTC